MDRLFFILRQPQDKRVGALDPEVNTLIQNLTIVDRKICNWFYKNLRHYKPTICVYSWSSPIFNKTLKHNFRPRSRAKTEKKRDSG